MHKEAVNSQGLKSRVGQISSAVALLCLAAPSFAEAPPDIQLNRVEINGSAERKDAAQDSPSRNLLSARSAQSVVSDSFVRDNISPVADYTQVLSMTPGVFSYSPNGVGLGDAKVTLRGLSDSYTVFSFDGIPFNDTNGVSHHSWVFFPAQFIGGAVVDRSPGSAATIGQATFGGSVDLQSRVLKAERSTSVTASSGSWNTHLVGVEHETGNFGSDGSSNLLFNVHEMRSDGYETYNKQDRRAISAKFQTALGKDTELTLFASYLDLKNNTPNIKGLSRSNYEAGNYTYLLSNDPTRGDFYGYNFYEIATDVVYAGISSRLGGGWLLEDKVYTYSYHNKQNYNGSATTISATSAVDKLNAYVTMGNLLRLSQTSTLGTLRTGLWLDRADSNRYQIPSDPRSWKDVAAPNFHETYVTTTLQPYVEFEFKLSDALRITPGVKFASYKQDFVHDQDNGGAVGPLGGVFNKTTNTITGGAPTLAQSVKYTDTLPSLDLHYQVRPNWSAYVQVAQGDEIPSTSVFDVPNAKVSQTPKATKATTSQLGTVWNSAAYSLAANVYYTKLDGTYTALPPDANGNVAYVASGTQTNRGLEAEGTLLLAQGLSLYANATLGSLKYANGQWVAGAPRDTETLGLNYRAGGWSGMLSLNRVGRMYNDAKDGTHEAFAIDPVLVSNLFVNYTAALNFGFLKQAKLQLGVNNLFDKHDIVGVASPAAGSSSAKPSSADLLTILPGRSVSLTGTLSF